MIILIKGLNRTSSEVLVRQMSGYPTQYKRAPLVE